MFFVGYRTFTPRPQSLPYANLNEKDAGRPQAQLAEAEVNVEPARRRTAAQSMPTKRKTGTVANSQSGSKTSGKRKRKVGPVRRAKLVVLDPARQFPLPPRCTQSEVDTAIFG